MPKGHRISFQHKNETKVVMVAIEDVDAAKDRVIAEYPGATSLVILPFKEGDFERLALDEGQVMESQ